MDFVCTICVRGFETRDTAITHYLREHNRHPRFVLQCNYCENKYYKSWQSFKNHISQKHPLAGDILHAANWDQFENDQVEPQLVTAEDYEELMPQEDGIVENSHNILDAPNEPAPEPRQLSPVKKLQQQVLSFMLLLSEEHHLPQSSVGIVNEGLENILKSYNQDMQDLLREKTTEECAQKFKEISCAFMKTQPLQTTSSNYQIKKQLVDVYHLVQPKEVILGEYYVFRTTNGLRTPVRKVGKAQIVPLKNSLSELLSSVEIRNVIFDPSYEIRSKEGVIQTVRDGNFYKTNELCQKYKSRCLLFQFYYDDVEVTNPLGSYTKTHKLAQFYWTLLNVPEYLRSHLNCINLIGSAKSEALKSLGFRGMLDDFLTTIRQLESPEGLTLNICGQNIVFHGTLVCCSADTPAANLLGGFKEGVGQAFRPCRNCMATRPTMAEAYLESEFELRTMEELRRQVAQIEDPTKTAAEISLLSRNFGITQRSVFIEQLPNFNITEGLCQDFMHVVYEGVAPSECKALLYQCIEVEQLLTFDDLNLQLASLDYPPELSKDKPSTIERHHVIEGSLRQSATQMRCLLIVLPFVLAPFILTVNRYYRNFLLLSKLANALMAFSFTPEQLDNIEVLIHVHHQRFIELYPHINFTPKFHYMIHLVSAIKKFGPVRNFWCMRFEGGHVYFNKLASAVRNFKCIEKTLALKFQRKRCYQLKVSSEPFLTQKVFNPKVLHEVSLQHFKYGQMIAEKLDMPMNTLVSLAKNIYVRNSFFPCGGIVLLEDQNEDPPVFGAIGYVCVVDQKPATCVLVVNILSTESYDELRNSYVVTKTKNVVVALPEELACMQVFPKFMISPCRHDIVLTNYAAIEYMG